MSVAVGAGVGLERRAIERVLESGELSRILLAVLDSPHLQQAARRALASEGALRLVDSFFDSGLLDRVLEQLAASDGLWSLIDEIAGSPAVTAAISQQGLGFADQVGGQVRQQSRKADAWFERTARRLVHRPLRENPADSEGSP